MTLDQFATQLERNTNNSSMDTMPVQLYKTIAQYLNERVLSLLISAAIVVTILFVFYGAFQYFTAYGDENKAAQAKKSITYAFVGFLVALMAMGIASYVQQNITSGRLTKELSVPTSN